MSPRRRLWPYLAHLPFVAWTFAGPLFSAWCRTSATSRTTTTRTRPSSSAASPRASGRSGTPPPTRARRSWRRTSRSWCWSARPGASGALRFGPPLHQLVAMCGASLLAAVLGDGSLGNWTRGSATASRATSSRPSTCSAQPRAAWAPWLIAAALRLWSRRARGRALAALPRRSWLAHSGAEIVLQTALAALVLLPSRPDRRSSGGDGRGGPRAAAGDAGAPGRAGLVAGTSRGAGFTPEAGFSFSLPRRAARRRGAAGVRRRPHVLRARLLGPALLPGRLPVPAEPLLRAGAPVPGAARSARSSETWQLLALAALGVLLALGDHGPLGWLLAPLVRHFRAPVKLLFLTNLALALLAARGLDRARRARCAPRGWRSRRARCSWPWPGDPRAARAARPSARRVCPRFSAARSRRRRGLLAREPGGGGRLLLGVALAACTRGRSRRSPACSSASTC